MLKKLIFVVFLGAALTLGLVACGSTSSATDTTGAEVHMSGTEFVQKSITIKKGSSLTLISDDMMAHIIANGTWDNGTAKPGKEPGAPTVANVQVAGNSQASIGPFNTAGTFNLYCTIHPGMNLTVFVR
ncbi:hypothetical protein EPA93_07630 [Ktedonosporobacter rubrisoli]|uniref:Blue (type 1) copper domain-containing protein n=1 Tax=Ktedonosporobacter rubrisoli TaxID=2509675 RepID=A0A4P6JL33_KTERU|nr:plastocyanin/azurin family copper-binding protein [Ktedonosporobacter rubrisoli]QBD75885.1 hypothetical protein EPA93_07630 [Ktedonosporobacter rubrisoli]